MSFHQVDFHQSKNPADSIKKVLEWLVRIRDDVYDPRRPDTFKPRKDIHQDIDLLIFYLEETRGNFKLIYPKRTLSV